MARWRNLRPDPFGAPRNPLAIYLLVLTFVSGLFTMLGLTTAKSIEDSLPGWAPFAWGFMLTFGSGTALTGMFWQGRILTGLLWKRIGMFALTIASFIYGVVILLATGAGGITSSGFVFGFGVSCAVQYHQLNERVRALYMGAHPSSDQDW